MALSLSPHREKWIATQLDVDINWLIGVLKFLERNATHGQPKMNDTLKTYASLPSICRATADSWFETKQRRRVGWSLLYAEATTARVSRVKKLAAKTLLGSEIKDEIENVLLVYKSSREDPGPRDRKLADVADTTATRDELPGRLTHPEEDFAGAEGARQAVPSLKPADAPGPMRPRDSADPGRTAHGRNHLSKEQILQDSYARFLQLPPQPMPEPPRV